MIELKARDVEDAMFNARMFVQRNSWMQMPPIATVTVPIRTVSEPNTRGHWSGKHRRNKEQQEAVGYALLGHAARLRKLRPCAWALHVHLTRLAPRNLDSDNLAGALKHVRDAVAKFLGVDDGREDLVSWSVAQDMAHAAGLPPKTYAVRIEFYRREAR